MMTNLFSALALALIVQTASSVSVPLTMKAFAPFLLSTSLVAGDSLRGPSADAPKDRQLQGLPPCIAALIAAEFEITNTADFSRWFGDGSVMEVAQAGTYFGLDGIQEYVNFIYTTWLFSDFKIIGGPIPNIYDPLATLVQDGNKCEVTVAINTCRSLDQTYVRPNFKSADALIGYRLFFDIVEGGIFINRANVYYPDAYLFELFGTAFDTDALREKNCEILRDSCETTWKMNFAENDRNIEHCKSEMAALDLAETSGSYNGYIDSDTYGCRVLHAGFAKDNPKHCPHVSLKKEADPNGRIKCSSLTQLLYDRSSPEDLFEPSDFIFFSAVGQGYFGYPAGEQHSFSDSQTCPELHPAAYADEPV